MNVRTTVRVTEQVGMRQRKTRMVLPLVWMALILLLTAALVIDSLRSLASISVAVLILCAYAQLKMDRSENKVYGLIFLVLLWLFHFGQLLLVGFNMRGQIPFDFRDYASGADQVKTVRYCLTGFFAFFAGYNLCIGSGAKTAKISTLDLSKVALFFLAVGVLPRLYIDANRVLVSMRFGYSSLYQSIAFPTALMTLGTFADFGSLLLISSSTSRKKSVLFVVLVLYKLLTFLSGARQEAVCFLLVVAVVYLGKRIIEPKYLFFGLLFVLSIVFFVYLSGLYRSDVSISTSTTPVEDMIGEFGSAFVSTELAVSQVPSTRSFGFGISYLAGIFLVIPGLASSFPLVGSEDAYVTKLLYSRYLGGSFFGEAYYNFGWFGVLVIALIGMWVKNVNFNLAAKTKNDFSKAFSLFCAPLLLLLIRGYFSGLTQPLFWACCTLLIMKDTTFFSRNSNKRR